jgi:VWFA-related protein
LTPVGYLSKLANKQRWYIFAGGTFGTLESRVSQWRLTVRRIYLKLGLDSEKGAFLCRRERGALVVRKIGALLGVFFSGIILAGPPYDLSAQVKGQSPPPLQYEVSVILKLIHVYVTDKSGKPVVDLTKDDFVLTDNGERVTLTEFERHILEAASAKAAAAAPPRAALAPSEGTNTPAPALMNRKFFLLFDFAYNNARGLQKAKKAALHFLDANVRADDEVAVLSYSALKGVVVRQYLTEERDKVREVLERIDRRENAGRANEAEDRYWRLVEALPGGEDTAATASGRNVDGSLLADIRGDREESKRQAETFIFKLTALAKALRLIPGQKQFILFSTGIPYTVMYGYSVKSSTYRDKPGSTAGDRVLRTRNEEMYKEFAASGCSFYSFDTRESAEPASLFAWDEMTMTYGARSYMFQPGAESQAGSSIFRDNTTTGQNSLKRLSDITGGKYYSNINMYEKNLGEVQNITGSFYVLGYSIGQEYDGRFHEVKVEVKRPGCVVRAQTGYFAPKPYAQYSDLEKRLHIFDLALNERSPFRMPVDFSMTALGFPLGAESRSEIVARIPGEITGKLTGSKAEFFTIAFDGNGDISDVRRHEADPRLHRGRPLVFSAGLALKPGDYDCRLVIRDMQTGMSAVASTRVTVGQAGASGLRLCTPLLLIEEAGMPVMDAGPGSKGDLVSWKDVYGFDPLSYSVAVGTISKNHQRIAVLVPYAPAGTGGGGVVFSATIVNTATGQRVPAQMALTGVTQGPTMETAQFELPTDGLEPGRYLLYIFAQDSESQARAHTQTGFAITAEGK